MQVRVSHLRRGELIAAAAAVVLVAVLFALPWFGAQGATTTGWDGLPVVRWLLLVTAAVGLLLAVFQQTLPAPALPVVLSVIVTALALVTAVVLVIRLPTSAGTPQVGAYLGLAAVLGTFVGGFWSLRDEDGWRPGPDRPIERVSLPSTDPR
jgi:hypothetical protein